MKIRKSFILLPFILIVGFISGTLAIGSSSSQYLVDEKYTPDSTIKFFAVHSTGNTGINNHEIVDIYRQESDSSSALLVMRITRINEGDSSLKGLAIAIDTERLWVALSIKDIRIAVFPLNKIPPQMKLSDSRWTILFENVASKISITADRQYAKKTGRPISRLVYVQNPGDRQEHIAKIELLDERPTLTDDKIIEFIKLYMI